MKKTVVPFPDSNASFVSYMRQQAAVGRIARKRVTQAETITIPTAPDEEMTCNDLLGVPEDDQS